ncbi:MAG: hypothetical protein BGO45_05370 [Microbacterium sp. 71-36]|uniref:hypothetical protein n=1 Tax=unclassified Microbacterium TaxID=2609290 RepID=UPI00086D54AD|nr:MULTISPECIES: hypothetical protein [unclassified Microbacterium]MBN9211311.1 hypothetical protein [Microbacterium sp.]ODT36593.1 MAG: hypothetical protein ABS60_15330 [Microbacterium sp. SCN 71-17]ODU52712.1 MAG: hypothetical protein ABT07_00590 [Microbacterium sp. SCN 70-10]OJV75129.1 MAG: hypothetical protein BGO45_05370 [Microbacterium sp. 71-36]
MTSTNAPQGSTAVWYFVAAVFVLTFPNLFFPDVNLALRIALLVAGLALMGAGFVQLRREIAAKSHPDDTPRADEE